MGDKINFPYNNKMYLEHAKNYIESNRFEEALVAIQKGYELDASPKVLHLYVSILYSMEDYEKALEIIDEHISLFTDNEEFSFLYVMVLIKTQHFIEAEVLMNQHFVENKSGHFEVWENIHNEFVTERDLYIYENERQKRELKLALSQLEMYPLHKQNEMITNAHLLTLNELKEIAPQIFSHPHLTGMIKKAFLERLIEKNDDTVYLFSWFNENKKILPSKMVPFSQEPILESIEKILQEKLIKSPELYEPIQAEIVNDLLMLYPFIDEVITDTAYWVKSYISIVNHPTEERDSPSPKTDEEIEMTRWIEKLNLIAQRKV